MSTRPLAVAWRLARRELRGGARGLGVFLACLALGVGAIAAVGVINAGIIAGVQRDAAALLGGDIEFENVNTPLREAEIAALVPAGARPVETVRTNAMARADDRRAVVTLKAVGESYPIYGQVALDPPIPLQDALANGGAVVERTLLTQLGLGLGDGFAIGEARFEVRAVLEREPDRIGGFINIGPRAMIGLDGLERTQALLPGSLARYAYGYALPPGTEGNALAEELRAAHPGATWRVRSVRDVEPNITRFTDRLAGFLTVAALTALLIGGVGVALAVQNYLGDKTGTIATLKCLGARSRTVFRVYLLQVLTLATLGVLLGLLIGQAAPWLLRLVPQTALPVEVVQGLYLRPLLVAAACGYLTTLVFTLWPLARARDTSAASIFRALVAPSPVRLQWRDLLALGGCVLGLAGLALIGVGDRRLGLIFVGVALGAALALTGLARLGLAALGRLGGNGGRPSLRLAIANLRRPGAGSAGVTVALGAGLAVLTLAALLQHNLVTELQQRLPERAPSFFFLDLQPAQLETFEGIIAGIEGARVLDEVPVVRGRVVRIAGQAADQADIHPDVAWTVRRDRGLTYRGEPPASLTLVDGAWWPGDYRGPPLVSVDAEVAQGYGVGLGDTLGFNILGRVIEAEIASTREIAWEEGGLNFVFVFSPGVLEAAPHSIVATVDSPQAQDARLIEAVNDRLPNVTPVSVRQVLAQVGETLGRIGLAVSAVGGVTLLSGVLVLAGAIAAARRRHLYESVVLKVLGARRLDLLRVFLFEYLGLGLTAALAGGVLGTAGAAIVVVFVMDLSWSFSLAAVLQVLALALVVTLVAGFIGTWRLLGRPSAPVLRAP